MNIMTIKHLFLPLLLLPMFLLQGCEIITNFMIPKTKNIQQKTTTYSTPTSITPILGQYSTAQAIWAKHGMVASQEALASHIGLAILKQGGNAVDAAVAVGYALAVTLPRAGNIGGGGFMLIHLTENKQNIAIDYREKAPSSAHRNIFLNSQLQVDKNLSRNHGLAVGIPGTVAGLELARKKYGSMTRSQLLAPAIKLAIDGIIINRDLALSLEKAKNRLSYWPTTQQTFYKKDGSNYQTGERLTQPDLAASLQRIVEQGTRGFYQGVTAQNIVDSVTQAGGIMTLNDLNNYQAIERIPIIGNYRDHQIISMPPPSSGGIHLVQMLNILENFPIDDLGHNRANTLHLMAETMKLAYADRSKYLGDPDFFTVPTNTLIDKSYAYQLAQTINHKTTTASKNIMAGEHFINESPETTHYSVIDKWGNAVSNTYTLNFSYGSGFIAKNTGILLNNQMDDFSAKAGTPNAYGLIGGNANAVEGNKRPLSSMTPTIVLKDNHPFLVTGSPGGSRIITTTLQIIMNVIDHKLNIAEATHAPRIHHQWLPDYLRVEKSLNGDTLEQLTHKGHNIKINNAMGSTQSIMKINGELYGGSDPRRSGSLTIGY